MIFQIFYGSIPGVDSREGTKGGIEQRKHILPFFLLIIELFCFFERETR